jgi:urease accessory protein
MHGTLTGKSSDTFAANRALGSVVFDVRNVDGVTRRGQLHESGSLRVRFPSSDVEGLSGVFVNTAGGIAGGDRFDVDITVAERARLTLTTAAAEKIYRSHGPASQLDIALRVADGAHLSWLPQETILFNQVHVSRQIEIDLTGSASLVLCEMVVFGRAAMGEVMERGTFIDRWRLRHDGRLVFAEDVRLDGDLRDKIASRAIGNGAVAIGTVLIAPGDEALISRIRDLCGNVKSEMGMSAWNGFAIARFCAQDAAQLRIDVMTVLGAVLSSNVPRLWTQ